MNRPRFGIRPWQLAVLVVVLCVAVMATLYLTRSRGLSTSAEMLGCLPRTGATLVYVNVDALRRSGLLDLIAGSRATEDIEYKNFIEGSGFNYRTDLDQVAAAVTPSGSYFVLRGRFDWRKLNRYVASQGGSCRNAFCRTKTNDGLKWTTYHPLRANVMALAVSTSDIGAYDIAARPTLIDNPDTVAQPVWISLPGSKLRDPDKLPTGTRSFLTPLENAEKIVFSVGPQGENLQLNLDVLCSSPTAASDLLTQLESATNMLRKMLTREKQTPTPSDLATLLVGGEFRREDRRVLGVWPVHRRFVETVVGGSVN